MLLKYQFTENIFIRIKSNLNNRFQVRHFSKSCIPFNNDQQIKENFSYKTTDNSTTTNEPIRDFKSKLDAYIKNYNKEPGFEWKQFYRFNHIKKAAMITKSKIYQSGLVAIVFADTITKYMSNTIEIDNFLLVNSAMVGSLLFLILIGQLARKVIGIAYYDPNYPDLIRLARLTFFGRRQNFVVNLRDIRPLSDTNLAGDSLFFRLVINIDGEDKMFFLASEKFATIDNDIYKKVFGTLK